MQVGVIEGVMILQLMAVILGFAVTWGKISNKTQNHGKRLAEIENRLTQQNGTPSYVTPKDCEDKRKERDKGIKRIDEYIRDHSQQMKDIENKLNGLNKDMTAIKSKLGVNRRATNGHS